MSTGSISIPNEPNMMTTTTRSQLPPRKPITLSVPRNGAIHMTKTSSGAQWAGERPKTDLLLGRNNQNTNILAQLQASAAAAKQNQLNISSAVNTSTNGASTSSANTPTPNEFDIALLREKSKHLDLPLISALCNDRSLLKQTKVLVNPKNPKQQTSATTSPTLSSNSSENASLHNHKLPLPTLSHNNVTTTAATLTSNLTTTIAASGTTTAAANMATSSSKILSSAVANKNRKTSISHRHPNDKLPPLPMQLAEANNYVMDPAILKHHKSYNSHT